MRHTNILFKAGAIHFYNSHFSITKFAVSAHFFYYFCKYRRLLFSTILYEKRNTFKICTPFLNPLHNATSGIFKKQSLNCMEKKEICIPFIHFIAHEPGPSMYSLNCLCAWPFNVQRIFTSSYR